MGLSRETKRSRGGKGSASTGELIQLVIGVKHGLFRMHDPDTEDADRELQELRRRVCERDNNTCRGCGMPTKMNARKPSSTREFSGYLEVHHLDDDHSKNQMENLVALCPFCHQIFHCGMAGRMDAAYVVWQPHLSQAWINRMVNLCASVMASEEEGETAQAILNQLYDDGGRLDEIIGGSMRDCSALGGTLAEIHHVSPRLYKQRAKQLYGLRLVPRPEAFKKAVEHWRQNVWPHPKHFDDLYEQWAQKDQAA